MEFEDFAINLKVLSGIVSNYMIIMIFLNYYNTIAIEK